jgi:hypothetical protein
VSARKPAMAPEEAQRIAAHARQCLACQACGAGPGALCIGPGRGRTVCKSRFIAAAIELKRQDQAARQTPAQAAERAAILAGLPQVSREEIEACRTPADGYSFTRDRLAAWGVPWPPPAGWRQALQRGQDDAP